MMIYEMGSHWKYVLTVQRFNWINSSIMLKLHTLCQRGDNPRIILLE